MRQNTAEPPPRQHNPRSIAADVAGARRGQPVRWITADAELAQLCEALRESFLDLDVETTIHSRTLSMIQVASAQATYLLDNDALQFTCARGHEFVATGMVVKSGAWCPKCGEWDAAAPDRPRRRGRTRTQR